MSRQNTLSDCCIAPAGSTFLRRVLTRDDPFHDYRKAFTRHNQTSHSRQNPSSKWLITLLTVVLVTPRACNPGSLGSRKHVRSEALIAHHELDCHSTAPHPLPDSPAHDTREFG